MPTYDYQCDECQSTFEQVQSIYDATLKQCPWCQGSQIKRLITAGGGIIFKGSGFYVTDKASKNSALSGGEGSH